MKFAIKSQTKIVSSCLLPAHGKSGARATINNNSLSPSEKFLTNPKQAGKKEGVLGEGIFARPPFLVVGGCASPKATHKSEFGVGILFKIGSDFVQKAPPFFRIDILRRDCLALATLGLGKSNDFIRIFEIKKQFLPQQTEVQFAEGKDKFEKFINQSFSFAFGERQSDNFGYFDCPII